MAESSWGGGGRSEPGWKCGRKEDEAAGRVGSDGRHMLSLSGRDGEEEGGSVGQGGGAERRPDVTQYNREHRGGDRGGGEWKWRAVFIPRQTWFICFVFLEDKLDTLLGELLSVFHQSCI